MVSFCEAVYEATCSVEEVRAVRINAVEQASKLWEDRLIPLIIDPTNNSKDVLKPDVVIDAIMAKENLGTTIKDAELVVALGPGFNAGTDVHFVVETNRGHDLGRLIYDGEAAPNTGVPGEILGRSRDRVIRAPVDGIFQAESQIGQMVVAGQHVGSVGESKVVVSLDGVLRGLIRQGTPVRAGLKIGDVDPRSNPAYCTTISEKARAIGGTVLEAVLIKYNTP